ncbi:Spy/CpxP family protein refolding chaperone [Halomonas sp. JS92-SW72]|uniref:Spy/CpxP family protein refolding chaperone n=1 Tax=Halomonas sp. JS92-SW72 TaxID=2306583 RepID=UPI000E5C1F59|nr:Spy/CpxP family protein refolding chaperone [Halomonas sp. JS92-SW72]AXY43164.1 periplasmic heavy metal sensor [Halomonas sp. JS92-SW72]
MNIRKQTLALGLALAIGASGSGIALAHGMPDSRPGQGSGMMGGMMGGGGQGGMGPGMMGGMMGGGGQGGMGPGMMGGMMGGGMMPCPMMGEGMGMMSVLDSDQRSQMRELMQEHRPAQFERKGRLMNLRDDLMAEMHGERPDPEQVQELHGRMAELHGEMMAEMVRMRNAMHDLMTDEQREQLRQAAPADVDPEDHDAHH